MAFLQKLVQKTVFPFIGLLIVLNSATYGQAIRPITVSDELIRVDDGGSERARLGFRINFFGVNYDSVWVNNNGNLTFNSSYSTYTPYLIQQNTIPMFAAFFADVDTRTYGDVTRYGQGTLQIAPGNVRNIFCINWINVGCFALSNASIVNSFQMIIIDRSDIAPGDFDLEYNYDKIIWEAGQASGGNELGLGGTTAVMGWSNGTSSYYCHPGSLQVGAFLDAGPRSLIRNRLNSTVDGRYIFFVRNGVVVDLLGPQTFSIRETARPLSFVGRVNTTSVYSRDSITFSILPPAPAEFTLASDTSGAIRVGAGIRFDYETRNQYTFNVVARFQGRATVFQDTALMTVNIINVEPEQFLRDTVFTISEITPPGTAVGRIQAPLATNPRFALAGPSPDFVLDATGNLSVSATANLDFERQPQYLLPVIGSYINGTDTLYDTAVITVNLLNITVGDLISNQSFLVRENAVAGTAAGTIALNVSPSIVTLSLLGALPPEFNLDLTTRVLTVAPGAALDYETTPVYTFRLLAQAREANDDTATITINIQDVAVGDLILNQTFSIPENSVAGTPVATIALNASPALITLSLLDALPAEFTLDLTTRNLVVAPGAILDYETTPVYTFRLLAQAQEATDDTALITVNLRDSVVGDLISNQGFTLLEHRSPGSAVGTIALNVPPAMVSLSVLGTLPPEFTLDFASRTLTVAPGADLEYDVTPVYTFRLLARAQEANDDTALITISLIRNRPPLLTATSDTTINERNNLRLSIFASDSDGTVPSISVVRGLPAGSLFTDSGNGRAYISWQTGCNDHGTDTITIRAADGIDSVFSDIVVHVVDINFPPSFLKIDNPNALQLRPYSYTVQTVDCDGPAAIRAVNLPSGASFRDNGDGTGTLLWTPRLEQAGYYMVIFEARDDATSVRDTVLIIVQDAGLFRPILTVSTVDTSIGINLPFTLVAHATTQDGTVPQLFAVSAPAGSQFVTDDAGNGFFSWTPHDSGVVTFVVTARNVVDSTLQTSQTVKIAVQARNITGPKFIARADTVIDQRMNLSLAVRARDPDGGIPELSLVDAPAGVGFVDSGNGNGAFTWKPGCDVAGTFILRAAATDRYLCDTISVGVEVRVVNFPPSFAPMPDVNAIAGDMVHIFVSAADQCIGSTTPMLSVSCELAGYTFQTHGDGTAVFGWKADNQPGSYPVYFYATNGYATACDTVLLTINKTGSLILVAKPQGARIRMMPAMNYAGTLLGTDSVCCTMRAGTYWFEVEAAGFRSVRMPYRVKADSVVAESVELKPSIPLMFTGPDSIVADTGIAAASAGAVTFADVNGDGLEDVSVISGDGFITGFGFNTGADSGFAVPVRDSAEVRTPLTGPISHVFADWKNSGSYSAIVSQSSGAVLLLNPVSGRYAVAETLCTNAGARPLPMVMDANRDGKKDLVVHSEGKGVYVYLNTGSDSAPVLGSPREITDSSGHSITQCTGAPLLIDMNQTGSPSWIFSCGGVLKVFAVDSACSTMKYESELNCAGKICSTDSLRYALAGSASGQPRLVTLKGRTMKIYATHLCGDVNGDKVVDIRDISRISKLWEITETAPDWVPLYNLKLSGSGVESIDIRDISRASKCWELQE